ncbi:phenylalanine--tRNA ligase subunit beta [Reichenbachiella sp. 5M10]|uniref:phenylalanine--tRNA ligase subunit beta n=1 Tax=Reichenbachiella sp. 5M10 TaxID=1889772 RepID=UPI000C15B395|nr:phenylalanine--tRNA ligase subunit beta [Reichenbachiella sp. 5M10]PIB34379.1 phenylalanine--tRNA ligase subunit beta [Reichenbachiella sp. 5M10]
MKISLNWLKEYIDLEEGVEDISQTLTNTGLEVEGVEEVEEIKGSLAGLVIGEVKSCVPHPDADKLSLTTVDIGEGELSPIVCGAPNVAAGQKVVVATVGATLYPGEGEPFKIKKAKIRGEVSLGMICAEDEIGLGSSHDGIMVLDTDLANGTPAAEYFNPTVDTVFEIGLTPNRADAASHYGVARDLKAAYERSTKFPDLSTFAIDNTSRPVEVIVENSEACPRYSGLTISNVKVAESPKWLKARLNSIGLAPINNIVDVTNYVLHSLGQPMHAFDLSQIKGDKIIVKTLEEGTPFLALDEKERKLSSKDLMICNASEGMCIAGVFGGIDSGVKETTTDVFLESAYFSSDYVRNTATRHSLKTDASFRFERGTDPRMTVDALKWAALLIKELAGGEISSEIVDVYPEEILNQSVVMSYKNIDRLIGVSLPKEKIRSILEHLDIQVAEVSETGFVAVVPPYRFDVTREADVIEEILRIYGYNNIGLGAYSTAGYLAHFPAPDKEKIQEKTGLYLSALGLNEIMSNSLTNPDYVAKGGVWSMDHNVEVLNKLSEELGVMRQTLVFSGLESLKHNINRKQTNLKFYEFGRVYHKVEDKYKETPQLGLFFTGQQSEESWSVDKKSVDFHDMSAVVHKLLDKFSVLDFDSIPSENQVFEYGLDIRVNGVVLVSFGKLKAKLTKIIGVNQEVFFAEFNWTKMLKQYGKTSLYKEVSKFPEVRRDLSLVIDKDVQFNQIMELAKTEGRKLVKRINVFSVYEGENIGEGKKSYALSFILQDEKKTLNDKVIDKTMNALMASFEKNLNAIIRK